MFAWGCVWESPEGYLLDRFNKLKAQWGAALEMETLGTQGGPWGYVPIKSIGGKGEITGCVPNESFEWEYVSLKKIRGKGGIKESQIPDKGFKFPRRRSRIGVLVPRIDSINWGVLGG